MPIDMKGFRQRVVCDPAKLNLHLFAARLLVGFFD